MDDSRLRFGVGVLVIAAIGIGIILTFLFGAVPRVFTDEFRLMVMFPAADGISTNTPVQFRGVEIGRVIDKKLEGDGVMVTLGIESRYRPKLTHQYVPRIGTGSFITGDSKLEFVKVSDEELPTEILPIRDQLFTNDEWVKYGTKSTAPTEFLSNIEDELRATLESVRTASGALRSVGDNVNQLVGDARGVVAKADDQVLDVGEEARLALEEFQGAMRDVRDILGDEELKQSLSEALAELPELLNETQTTLQTTQRTFDSFEKVGQRFERVGAAAEKTVGNVDRTIDSIRGTVESADKAIRNVERITQPIAENSDQIVEQVLTSLANLDKTLVQVEAFGNTLNNSNGTMRRLLEDEELYWQLRRTVENVEQATARIRPILDDVRIFSDKIARDPRQLGVRGALDKRPSGAGLK